MSDIKDFLETHASEQIHKAANKIKKAMSDADLLIQTEHSFRAMKLRLCGSIRECVENQGRLILRNVSQCKYRACPDCQLIRQCKYVGRFAAWCEANWSNLEKSEYKFVTVSFPLIKCEEVRRRLEELSQGIERLTRKENARHFPASGWIIYKEIKYSGDQINLHLHMIVQHKRTKNMDALSSQSLREVFQKVFRLKAVPLVNVDHLKTFAKDSLKISLVRTFAYLQKPYNFFERPSVAGLLLDQLNHKRRVSGGGNFRDVPQFL